MKRIGQVIFELTDLTHRFWAYAVLAGIFAVYISGSKVLAFAVLAVVFGQVWSGVVADLLVRWELRREAVALKSDERVGVSS